MRLEVNVNGPWELFGYSDAYYAGANETQKSVTGYIVLINGFFITWRYRSQKTVTLYVTEAEYSAIAEVCCKILFVCAILLFMGVVVECPMNVHVDNFGNIFLIGEQISTPGAEAHRCASPLHS